MSDFEPEPGTWRGLSFSKIAIAAILAVGFCIGIMVGWLSSPGPGPEPAEAPHAQQAASTIMQETSPLITNMPVLPEQESTAVKEQDQTPEPAASAPEPIKPAPTAPLTAQAQIPAQPEAPVQPEPAAKPEPPADPAASAPPAQAAAKPAAKPKAVKHEAARHEAQPTPADGTGPWVIQLGAFQSEDHAKLLLGTLTAHGYPAEIAPGKDKAGDPLFCVRSGHYPSRAAATRAAQELARREKLPTYVIEVPATAG
ncbi:MAG TPA: SPOR domain-containing protein [Aliidongia sp.]|nr:SPOR domain-containing protein [Aliidongia sp.]